MIRTTCITAALALALAASAPSASAQGIIPAVIGQTIANMSAGMPEDCLDGSKEPTVEQAARFSREAEPAMRAYRALAAAGSDVAPSFVGRSEQHWTLDGNVSPFRPSAIPGRRGSRGSSWSASGSAR
jgi:hypothetical protein